VIHPGTPFALSDIEMKSEPIGGVT
jgi:hypothetical protein